MSLLKIARRLKDWDLRHEKGRIFPFQRSQEKSGPFVKTFNNDPRNGQRK